MTLFCCPVCGKRLEKDERKYSCINGHSFDISRYRYVNLLMSNKSAEKRHGDDKLMIRARRDFLNKGYYAPLAEKAAELLTQSYMKKHANLIDVGCGEAYYSKIAADALQNRGIELSACGIDISKDALIYAGKRSPEIEFAAASAFNIPVESECFDVAMNFFAPNAEEEFRRILKKGGLLLRALPLEEHLFALKKKIYEKPYKNEVPELAIPGFEIRNKVELKYMMNIEEKEDILNLFKMTPYYYKTGREDQQKISTLENCRIEAEFCLVLYLKE